MIPDSMTSPAPALRLAASSALTTPDPDALRRLTRRYWLRMQDGRRALAAGRPEWARWFAERIDMLADIAAGYGLAPLAARCRLEAATLRIAALRSPLPQGEGKPPQAAG